ncbi:hypothetical protein, partial [Streptomyces sp. NPDC057131]|uniref:hypothetical protein n=1 Tax=Streptomyces sp. NPDC057131 TaxID=3346027 RepID=UPI0036D32E10
MATSKEQKRLTLVGSAMPEEVYKKLKQHSDKRSLTPYILNLIEKEETLDKLIESLSSIPLIIDKVNKIESKQDEIVRELRSSFFQAASIEQLDEVKESEVIEIEEGRIDVSQNLSGGIEEDT